MIKGEKLTAAQAIKKECWYCFGMARSFKCPTKICKLADKSVRSSVKKIKAHCITCVPEQSIHGVKKCKGLVLNPISHSCPLHPFRMGKNPDRGKLVPAQLVGHVFPVRKAQPDASKRAKFEFSGVGVGI